MEIVISWPDGLRWSEMVRIAKITKLQNRKWQNGKKTKWQYEKMEKWKNCKMTKWPNVRIV